MRILGCSKQGDYGDYRLLSDGRGNELHLTQGRWTFAGWCAARIQFALNLYTENVTELARRMGGRVLHPPEDKPSRMFQFARVRPGRNAGHASSWPTGQRKPG